MTRNELLKKSNIIKGHTIKEYYDVYGDLYDAGEVWDFSVGDVTSEAVELDANMVYWYINGRIYETGEYIA